MKSYPIAKSRRVRSTPYTSRIENQGVTAYTVYNHMLLPAAFGSLEESCDHLKKMFKYGMYQQKDRLKFQAMMQRNLFNL